MRADKLAPGTVLGQDFCIERKLAEGGMGTVYVAMQRSTGQRRAVKVFSPEVAVDDDLRRRFMQEARIGARIASEHIATVITAGVEGTLPWLAMELLDGETLTQRIAHAGPLDAGAAREFFAQLGHALVEAHRAGVAHRDLKPDNIFIARSQRAGVQHTVKVLDFGIAKVSDALSRTTTSMSFGTPLWMAPEQMFPGAAGFSSDVWALGLVAFYALTGRVYWRAGNADVVDTSGLAQERLSPRLEPATARSRLLVGHDPLPPGFDAWFGRCVVTDPQARHGTMVEALAGLDALLGATPTPTAAVPSTVPKPTAAVPSTVSATLPTRTPSVPMAYVATEVMRGGGPVERPPRRAVRWASALGALALLCVLGTGLGWVGRGAVLRGAPTEPRLPSPVLAPPPSPALPSPEERRTSEDTVSLPGGTVRLNSREVYEVAPFSVDRREVTVDAYAACVARGACRPITRQMDAGSAANVCNARMPGRGHHPINCVRFAEAAAYCAWRGARLLRNSEWEHAARGLSSRTWPWGEYEPTPRQLNACGLECPAREGTALEYLYTDAWPTTAPVGLHGEGATPEGVLDLAGNVSEWVEGDQLDPQRRRTVRGGGFLDGPVPSTRALRYVAENYVGRTIGFRCAR